MHPQTYEVSNVSYPHVYCDCSDDVDHGVDVVGGIFLRVLSDVGPLSHVRWAASD
jgi:hypothetical protein